MISPGPPAKSNPDKARGVGPEGRRGEAPGQKSDAAPDFTLTDPAGKPYRLSAAWAEGPALLVFYPADDTSVCTKQLCEYRDRWADFRALGVNVVGINPAGHQRHAGFAQRRQLPFLLLSDAGSACCRAYGAAAWYGTRRLVVLVDRAGRERWRKATFPFFRPGADELLAAMKTALSG